MCYSLARITERAGVIFTTDICYCSYRHYMLVRSSGTIAKLGSFPFCSVFPGDWLVDMSSDPIRMMKWDRQTISFFETFTEIGDRMVDYHIHEPLEKQRYQLVFDALNMLLI